MVKVASYGRPYPAIAGSVIPKGAWNKETYLKKTYEGMFKLQYSPRLPTPREAVVALSYAIDKFEVDNPGVKVVHAVIDHPSDLEMAAGSVPSCRFQFVTEHHSPFLLAALIAAIGLCIAAGLSMATAGFLQVMAIVFFVIFLVAVADYVVNHILRGPTIKCPKCDKDFDYLGVGAIEAHWKAEHSDQDEPDWEKLEEAYSASQIGNYVIWGLVGIGGVVGIYFVYKVISSRPRKERPKPVETGEVGTGKG